MFFTQKNKASTILFGLVTVFVTAIANNPAYSSSRGQIEINLKVIDALEEYTRNEITHQPKTKAVKETTESNSEQYHYMERLERLDISTIIPKKRPQLLVSNMPKPIQKPAQVVVSKQKKDKYLANIVPVYRQKAKPQKKPEAPQTFAMGSKKKSHTSQLGSKTPITREDPFAIPKDLVIASNQKDVPKNSVDDVKQDKNIEKQDDRVKRLEELLTITRPEVEGNTINKVIKNKNLENEGAELALNNKALEVPSLSDIAMPETPIVEDKEKLSSSDNEHAIINLEAPILSKKSTVTVHPNKLLKAKDIHSDKIESSDETISMSHSVHFDNENTHLSPESKKQIEAILATLQDKKAGKKISIVGYAQSPSDSVGTARRISLQRAIAVRNFIIRSGIDSSQIANVQAKGDVLPDHNNQNRVDILMVNDNKS